jgi:glycosyltransferase involved in cell wall biosynthesis
VIYNARDPRDFAAAAAAKEPFILTAGRIWDEAKNTAALEAIAPRVRWPTLIAGPGRAEANGSPNPRFLGPLDPSELAAVMARASIYALPARYEPFGLSALEAALCGCALVLGDIESLREIWGDAAVFVAPDDHDELAVAINRLIEQPNRRAALADSARRRAAHFSPQRLADEYLAVYRHSFRGMLQPQESIRDQVSCAS